MVFRSAVFALFLLSIPATRSSASTQAPPPNAEDLRIVECRLAPTIKWIAGKPHPVGARSVRTTAADCRVRGGLELARKAILKTLAGLHPLRCGEASCYSSSEVADAVSRIRQQVHQAIPPQAEALALALDADLDRASQIGEPLPLNPIQPARSRPDNATTGYRRHTVADAFYKFAEALDHLLSHDRLAPDLTIGSNPGSADFVMQVGTSEITRRGGVTNTHLPTVWRGVYAAEARKQGYKTSRNLTINLMNDGRTDIFCELAPERADAESVCKVRP